MDLLPADASQRPAGTMIGAELVCWADRPVPPDRVAFRWPRVITFAISRDLLAILRGGTVVSVSGVPMSLEPGECARCGTPTQRLRGTPWWWHRYASCRTIIAGAYRSSSRWDHHAERAHVPLEEDWRPALPCPTPWTCSPHYCHGGCGSSSV